MVIGLDYLIGRRTREEGADLQSGILLSGPYRGTRASFLFTSLIITSSFPMQSSHANTGQAQGIGVLIMEMIPSIQSRSQSARSYHPPASNSVAWNRHRTVLTFAMVHQLARTTKRRAIKRRIFEARKATLTKKCDLKRTFWSLRRLPCRPRTTPCTISRLSFSCN